MKLMVILGSSRQGRKGEVVAKWVANRVEADERFELDYVDLRELNLPFFDEPLSPFSMAREGRPYTYPEGKAWAERVAAAGAFIMVTPEYNHGYPGVLKNALDWVGPEWGGKAVDFVSYSWTTVGGARAVEQLRQVVLELGLIPGGVGLHIGRQADSFDENGQPKEDYMDPALQRIFEELSKLSRLRN